MNEMKILRRFKRNKRGVSSIFIAIYLALIVVLLISTLYAAQVISRSSLTDYLKIEQDRRQENIQITNLVTDTNDRYFTSIQINNTGAIMVRIKALYVNDTFKFDPSELEGDSYIEPKEARNFTLVPPIIFEGDLLNAEWAVTTERGTRSSDICMNLWEETSGPVYTPNKFYFGPLMLVFDMFHWRSSTGAWKSGWSIPKSATDVTWRILLANVDSRPITLTDRSCFTLVGNEQQQNKIVSWFVNPELETLTFLPGHYYFVYYTWASPYSAHSNTVQKPNALTVGIPCINFLTFTGYFTELNGTQTAFGQTIPFEGVLITDETMVDTVSVTATPQNIKNDGISTAAITTIVKNSAGTPMANQWVDFLSTAGTLSASRVQTDGTGAAHVTLTSSTYKTTAVVYAMCQGVTGTIKVSFTPATKLRVTADPTIISKNGNSTITVQLLDQNNAPVSQSGIVVTATRTWSGSKPPVLIYQTQSDSTVVVLTDSNGKAIITLAGKGGAGTTTITASADGLASGSASIVLENS
jgi:Flp pilus assembly pilin Flp